MCVWLVGRGEGGGFLLKILCFSLSVNTSLIGSVNSFFYIMLGTFLELIFMRLESLLQQIINSN